MPLSCGPQSLGWSVYFLSSQPSKIPDPNPALLQVSLSLLPSCFLRVVRVSACCSPGSCRHHLPRSGRHRRTTLPLPHPSPGTSSVCVFRHEPIKVTPPQTLGLSAGAASCSSYRSSRCLLLHVVFSSPCLLQSATYSSRWSAHTN